MTDDDAMTGGELQTVREYLGLTGEQLAALLEVTPRTVRAWEAGDVPIPTARREGRVPVREAIERLEADTAAAVGELVAALRDARDPAVVVYRTDADMHAARPDLAHMPARWWRHVVARACEEVPGVVIGTLNELAQADPKIFAAEIAADHVTQLEARAGIQAHGGGPARHDLTTDDAQTLASAKAARRKDLGQGA